MRLWVAEAARSGSTNGPRHKTDRTGETSALVTKLGLWVNAVGLSMSIVGTLLLFLHVTNRYHSAIQDMNSIALGYLGLILLGVCVAVTGVGVLLSGDSE